MKKCLITLLTIVSIALQAQENSIDAKAPAEPDYSKEKYWSALPFREDAADAHPDNEPWISDSLKQVDVFYIYPTMFMKGKGWNADVNNKKLNKRIDTKPVRYQASVFNASCRVYAPRYRQAHIRSFYAKPENSKAAFDVAYSDVKRAFDYYLQHYNNGRPIIIASHSQGTYHARRLMKDYFDNNKLQKQLVAAYIVGYAIYDTMYTNLKPCVNGNETGCYITWASFKKGYKPVLSSLYGNICVNPVSWTSDTIAIDRSKSMGGILLDFNKEYKQACTTEIRDHHLWVQTNMPIVSGMTNLHIADYNLFWYDIRENVKKRVATYLATHPK
ncbi:MAG: DUF3089 domain-containing protein [Chitinophagales bacterium]